MATQSRPSAKGTLVLGAVVAVRRHREKGRITEHELEVRLRAETLALLEQKLVIAAWYPIECFCELMDVNWEIAGKRDPDFMRREGERSADRLFETGIYPQLRFVDETARAERRDELVRQSRLITSITGSLYNFLQIEVRLDPNASGNLEIVYGNAAPFSEALRFSTEGFMNQINKRQKSQRRWTSERPAPDRIVFRMPLPERLA
ncbi:MAG TPA: hypothetical protein VFY49_20205 [Myxococcota bacterium]|nr:hypothetical protein [Myxococcota bacterium]